MKLSEYAKQEGISYRTAWNWYKQGKIEGYQSDILPTNKFGGFTAFLGKSGTIIVTELDNQGNGTIVIYARVSSYDQRDDLNHQLQRLRDYASVSGLIVLREVAEITSGLNDNRPKLSKLLADSSISTIIVEHKDRLTR